MHILGNVERLLTAPISLGRFVYGLRGAACLRCTLLIVALVFPSQSANTKPFKIEGCAVDVNGTPVVALIRISAQDPGKDHHVRTDRYGCYRYSGLAPGTYVVAVEPRYFPSPPPQTVTLNQDARVDFKIESASATPAIPDQMVTVDDGRFLFRSLQVVERDSSEYLAGTVTNQTSHTWEHLIFDLEWTDSEGGAGNLGTVICLSVPVSGDCNLAITPGSPGMMLSSWHLPQRPYSTKFSLASGYYVPNYRFSLQRPTSSNALEFEDSGIAFAAQVGRQGIAVAIVNKSDQPIRIDWNQVSYIDQTGKANAVTHEGVKYTDAANVKPPTVIPPSARHEDTIMPVGNVKYSDGWTVEPLLPMGTLSRGLEGKTISLFMPMEISGKIQNYTFGIRIESVN